MKISSKMLHIPPYISTPWDNIRALHIKDSKLIVTFINNSHVDVPNLDLKTLDEIFKYFENFQETRKGPTRSLSFGVPLNGENIGSFMQHNPQQANMENIPPDILKKIVQISKVVSDDNNLINLPKPVDNCNCMFCQIARSLLLANGIISENLDEEVDEKELQFRPTWEIQEMGDKLFIVTNPLDSSEKYNVYLGNPIGCTCGQKNCEHILAVLKS